MSSHIECYTSYWLDATMRVGADCVGMHVPYLPYCLFVSTGMGLHEI